MNDAQFAELAAWIAAVGLAGESEPEMVAGFCTRAVQLGLPLARGSVLIDTLHPHYEGHAVNWQAADGKTTLREYGFSSQAKRRHRTCFIQHVRYHNMSAINVLIDNDHNEA